MNRAANLNGLADESIYESELYDLFVNEIQRIYNLEYEDKAYKYFMLRYLIYNCDKKKREIGTALNICRFLLAELNIPLIDNSYFIYKEKRISVSGTIYSIIQNWEFRASLVDEIDIWQKTISVTKTIPMKLFIDKAYSQIIHKANNLAKKKTHRNNREYNIYFKYFSLLELNNLFKAKISSPKIIENIYYGPNHNPYARTLEEKLEGYIHYLEFGSNNISLIEERKLEDYMIENIEKIEEGLKYIDRQVPVEGGRIDILARDRNGILTIIELKVEEDKDLIWQCLYYPEAIKEKYKVAKVRMITLCPEYKHNIMKVLSNIEHLETYEYKLQLNSSKIKDIAIFKKPKYRL